MVKQAQVNQFPLVEEVQKLQVLPVSLYLVQGVQVNSELEPEKAMVHQKSPIKYHKENPLAPRSGADHQVHTRNRQNPNMQIDHMQTLTLQDATMISRFDTDKLKDLVSFKSQTQAVGELLLLCVMLTVPDVKTKRGVLLN